MESNYTCNNSLEANMPLYVFFSSVMIVELILGLPLNISVLYLFIFKLKFWKSKGNMVLLFNLVLADFLLLISLPAKVNNFQNGQRFSDNEMVCKGVLFMLFLNRSASVTYLTIICIDRYLSVVHPNRRNFLTRLKRSPQWSFLVWGLLLPLTIPMLLKPFESCNSPGPEEDNYVDVLRELVFFNQIFIPFVTLVYCTVLIVRRLHQQTVGDQTKLRKAVCAVTTVVVVFSICFLPRAASRLALLLLRVNPIGMSVEIACEVYDGIICFSHMDCLLDPLVYCFCSSQFKNAYLKTFFPCLQQDDGQNQSSSEDNPNPQVVHKNR